MMNDCVDMTKIPKSSWPALNQEFLLTVNYGLAFSELISRGKYDRLDWQLSAANFIVPTKLVGQTIITPQKIFCFGRKLNTAEVLDLLNKDGYRPANMFELLVFGEVWPEVQRYFSLVALGATCFFAHDFNFVACLIGNFRERSVFFHETLIPWPGHFCFLASKLT